MIQIKDTSFRYVGEGVNGSVEQISLDIKKGECVVFCGRSGCGKTTIMRLINRLIPGHFAGAFQGEVRVNQEDTFDMPMYQLAERVGSVFQNPRTQFFQTDTDSEIVFGCENCGMPQEQLEIRRLHTLKELKLEALAGRNIFEMSGGEKQKIAFASVYAMNPAIYLLDEPSSNLDIESVNELRAYLEILKEQGKTIVLTEHRLYYLMGLADRIVYIEEGRIQQIFLTKYLYEMSQEQRRAMGLRAIDLEQVHVMRARVKPAKVERTLLEAKEVSIYRKKRKLLEKINFVAGKGEVIAITGTNGSGKTTLLRTICGLHSEYDGDFLREGVVQKNKQRLKHSYMVMQDVNYQLFAENVEAECRLGLKHPPKKKIEDTLQMLNLYEWRERHPNTLSGGQKQRLAIAVSVVCDKEILILDEPTSGLDYDSMKKVADLLRELSKDKLIFVVTHDYELICEVCTRILHFEQGKLRLDIPVEPEQEEVIKRAMKIPR